MPIEASAVGGLRSGAGQSALARSIHVLAVFLLMSGCLATVPHAGESCGTCSDQRLVRIDEAREDSARSSPFGHPLSLSSNQWDAIVRSVRIQSIHRPLLGASYRGATEPAFTEDESRYLKDALQRAFQEATATQRVVFVLERTGEAGLPQLMSGAWFVRQNQMHVQLANIRVTVTMPAIRKHVWNDPLAAQPGLFYETVPGDHQQLGQAGHRPAGPFQEAASDLTIDYEALTGHDTRSRIVPADPTTQTQEQKPSLEESFSRLKRLYEQGLITEEDYRMKKQQLLDRL